MKKFFTLALILSLGLSAGFAGTGDNIENKFNQSLAVSFSGAESVSWSSVRNTGIYQASFYLNDQRFHAYFNEEAELMATVRFVSEQNLPLHILQSISGEYNGYVVAEVAEMVKDGITTFYITLNDSSKEIMIESNDKGSLKKINSKKIIK